MKFKDQKLNVSYMNRIVIGQIGSIIISLYVLLRSSQLTIIIVFTPHVRVLFSPMVSGWAVGRAGGRREKVYPGCISETVRCRKLILGRNIG